MRSEASSLVFLQYLTTVFDNIQDGVLLVNIEPKHNYRLLLANNGFLRGTGYQTIEAGKDFKDVVAPRTYESLSKRYDKVAANKQPAEFTEELEMPLGRQTYEVRLIPILNAVGDCVQIAVIMRNITEVQELRTKLAETAKALQEMAKNLRRI